MHKRVTAGLAAVSILAACGGGGGGDSSTQQPAGTTATVSLSGVAAKGLMANAEVNVHAVKADGSIDPVGLLALPVLTQADGGYTLSFTGNKDQPYVVKVTATANTTHADEVTGQAQPLPAGFTMRALLVPAASGSVSTSATVTPFSEMAVSAAVKAGGVTASNVTQALSTVSQLLGFDPRSVAVVTSVANATPEQQKLAVMLASVSQLANDGALGCGSASASTGGGGDKIRCVVEALSAAASTSSIKLVGSGAGGADISQALNGAVQKVLTSSNTLASQVASSVVTAIVANLGCTGSACTAAAAGTTPPVNAVAAGIAAARLMFNDMTSDWRAMFSRGGLSASASGAVNSQAMKFRDSMNAAYVPAAGLVVDTALVVKGVKLFNDFNAGRSSATDLTAADGFTSGDGSYPFASSVTSFCRLFTNGKLGTAPVPGSSKAGIVLCNVSYFVSQTVLNPGPSTPYTESFFRHSYVLTPNADGSFAWKAFARKLATKVNCPANADCASVSTNLISGQVLNISNLADTPADTAAGIVTGTVTPKFNSAGNFDALALLGDMPAGFDWQAASLRGTRQSVAINATEQYAASGLEVIAVNLNGTINALDASGNAISTLTVKSGSAKQVPVAFDAFCNPVSPTSPRASNRCHRSTGYALSDAAFDIRFETPTATVEGVVSVGGLLWDLSGTRSIPTQVDFTGTASNIAAGSTTDFFVGKVSAKATGYATGFDATKALSASNGYTEAVTVSGKVTAPSRPVLLLSLGGNAWTNSHTTMNETATVQYKSVAASKTRSVVNIDASASGTAPNKKWALKLTESVANLGMSWTHGDASVKLTVGGATEIGSVNLDSGLITYTDGSTTSLAIGL